MSCWHIYFFIFDKSIKKKKISTLTKISTKNYKVIATCYAVAAEITWCSIRKKKNKLSTEFALYHSQMTVLQFSTLLKFTKMGKMTKTKQNEKRKTEQKKKKVIQQMTRIVQNTIFMTPQAVTSRKANHQLLAYLVACFTHR